MRIGLLCCWSNMRIYPIYSSHLQKALEKLTSRQVPVVTTNCMCFDKGNPVDHNYNMINLPYLTRTPSRTKLKYEVKTRLYPALEYIRGRSYASRSNDFDIVDFQQSSYAFGYEALASFLSTKSKARKVVTIHKLDAIQYEQPSLNRVYNKADGVITFSQYMKDMLVGQDVSGDRVHVVYHGTSLPPLEDARREQAIVFCGSPIPHIKGFEHLVVALRLLRESGTELPTRIYGFFMPAEKQYAERHAVEQGVQDLLTWQTFRNETELLDEHRKSRMCLIPYTGYAGFFPAAYAMGSAVPVIATDILGHSEYVDGTGLLVPPAAPEELVAAVRRLLDDEALAAKLGAAGRKRAEETLSWDAVAVKTLKVFNSVLERTPSPA